MYHELSPAVFSSLFTELYHTVSCTIPQLFLSHWSVSEGSCTQPHCILYHCTIHCIQVMSRPLYPLYPLYPISLHRVLSARHDQTIKALMWGDRKHTTCPPPPTKHLHQRNHINLDLSPYTLPYGRSPTPTPLAHHHHHQTLAPKESYQFRVYTVWGF